MLTNLHLDNIGNDSVSRAHRSLLPRAIQRQGKQAAETKGMKDILAKARESRNANIEAKKNIPVAKKNAGVPAVRKKAPVPV